MKSTIVAGAMAAALLLGSCASAPKTYMLVPSRTTVPQLESLSRQPGTTVNVLTAQRTQQTFRLDGAGGGALTGAASDGAATQRVPFEDAALVYYSTGNLLATDKFPILPAVGAAEQQLDCDGLKVELGRTEAIRWLARQQGSLPFTAHEAAVQHGKNALKDIGVAVLVVVAVAACSGGGCSGFGGGSSESERPAVSVEAYRWAVTRADQREIGLLGVSRNKHCTARPTGTEPGTDREVLDRIEESHRQLSAHAITDKQQIELQTQWLDRLYGAPGVVAAKATEAAIEDLTGRNIVGVSWVENQDAENHPMKAFSHIGRQGHLSLRADGMTLSGDDSGKPSKQKDVTVQFSELADAVVAHYGRWRGVVLTYRDGRKDTLEFSSGMMVDRELTQQVGSWLKTKIDGANPP